MRIGLVILSTHDRVFINLGILTQPVPNMKLSQSGSIAPSNVSRRSFIKRTTGTALLFGIGARTTFASEIMRCAGAGEGGADLECLFQSGNAADICSGISGLTACVKFYGTTPANALACAEANGWPESYDLLSESAVCAYGK